MMAVRKRFIGLPTTVIWSLSSCSWRRARKQMLWEGATPCNPSIGPHAGGGLRSSSF